MMFDYHFLGGIFIYFSTEFVSEEVSWNGFEQEFDKSSPLCSLAPLFETISDSNVDVQSGPAIAFFVFGAFQKLAKKSFCNASRTDRALTRSSANYSKLGVRRWTLANTSGALSCPPLLSPLALSQHIFTHFSFPFLSKRPDVVLTPTPVEARGRWLSDVG